MKQIYLVGGAVRDKLLGLEPKDLDYVVVGSTPEEMLNEGYQQVGADFPVFIHPETGDEYALARTEVKTGTGYNGFTCAFGPEVTLEEDLRRRDLTINSIAMSEGTGEVLDPLGGREDLRNGIFRESSRAFTDDKVRLLRLGRFCSRFPSFTCSDSLLSIAREMADEGFDDVTPERIWLELEKVLATPNPSRFFEFLCPFGLFPEVEFLRTAEQTPKWHPEGDAFIHTMMALDHHDCDPLVGFGILCHDLGKPVVYKEYGVLHGHEAAGVPVVHELCKRLKVPKLYTQFGGICSEQHTRVHMALEMKPKSVYKTLSVFFNKQHLFEPFLKVCAADKAGRGGGLGDLPYPEADFMRSCMEVVTSYDHSKDIEGKTPGPNVGVIIMQARIKALKEHICKYKQSMQLTTSSTKTIGIMDSE